MIASEARSDTEASLEQIVSDVREVEADDILEQLVNMIDVQRYSVFRCDNLGSHHILSWWMRVVILEISLLDLPICL